MAQSASKEKTPISFFDFYAKESPIPFYVMLGMFVLTNMLLVINFTPEVAEQIVKVRLTINTVLLWLCPMYFAFNLILWRTKPATIAAGMASIALVFILWNFIGGYSELFCTVVAVLLALLAYKRDYKVILKIVMIAHLVTVLAAIAGLGLGYATPRYKLDRPGYGVSLGLIYPNHLGRMIYMVMTIAWYLWGQKRKILTTVVFWVIGIIMWRWIKCRTNAIMVVAFPVCWWATTGLLATQKKMAQQPVRRTLHQIWNGIMVLLPFLLLALTYIIGRQKIVLEGSRFIKKMRLYSLSMRFISAGILFQVYGFPLLGRDILNESAPMEFMNGHLYVANIIDNAYIYYLIALGGIVLILCMAWLSYANWKMIKNKDHALLLISGFMLIYGLIEIATFQFEHNFIWFYPLTATAIGLAGGAPDEAQAASRGELIPESNEGSEKRQEA